LYVLGQPLGQTEYKREALEFQKSMKFWK